MHLPLSVCYGISTSDRTENYMCGIIGYTGSKANSLEILIEGLTALEYRGYDSAGVAAFDKGGNLKVVKSVGRVSAVGEKTASFGDSFCGIGHTRWATHGVPSDPNSHPHGTDSVQIVHNGIIENYAGLKAELTALGYTFVSETDTEIAAKLIDYYYKKCNNRLSALTSATERLEGSYALGVLFADEPGTIYAARKDSPLIIGIGDGANYIASDVTAILRRTRDYYQLDDFDVAVIKSDSIDIYNGGKKAEHQKLTASWDFEAAEKGGFDHFMLKEIHEEPEAMIKTLRPRIKDMLPDFSEEKLDEDMLRRVSRLHIVACGTAMHAGLIGKYMFEKFARIPVNVDIASEFRYNDPIIDENDLVIIVSQSGETADSLAALRLAKKKGAATLGIVNVIGSSIAREADNVLYTWAGPEIAVASTKAYNVQTALLTLLAVKSALIRGKIDEAKAKELTRELFEEAPKAVADVIAKKDEAAKLSAEYKNASDLFFIGRGIDYPLSCEGSLKLKEISYIHSEAYAAGELKHGTISLIEEGTPVIALATSVDLYDKMVSNIREVKARGAKVLMITAVEGENTAADSVVKLPAVPEWLGFFPAVTCLQLIAYYTSTFRGCDVDKPRNLAKSVTVE